jgi:hypothetical protein
VTASDDIPDLVEPVGEPSPDEIAEVAATGYPPVDAAIQRLHALPGRPTAAHPEVYEDVHRRLQDALADVDGS